MTLEEVMVHYFRKERIFRNSTLVIFLGITALGLYLGRMGLYDTYPKEMEAEITKFEMQKYRLLTGRITEEKWVSGFRMNPRWVRIVDRVEKVSANGNKLPLSEMVKDTNVDKEMLNLKASQAIEELKKEKILGGEKTLVDKKLEETIDVLKKGLPEEVGKAVKETSTLSLEEIKKGLPENMGATVKGAPSLSVEEIDILQKLGKPPEKYSQILKSVPLTRVLREKELLRKNIIAFVDSLKRGDEAYDAGNFFMAEDFYRNAWRYAQGTKSWEACLLIGIRFLTLAEPRRATGGKQLTAEQCFEDALYFAIARRSAQGCRKVGIALKLIGLEQLANLAFESAEKYE